MPPKKQRHKKKSKIAKNLKNKDGIGGSWIYVIGTRENPQRVKIGIASDPFERMGNLQSGDPYLYFQCAIHVPHWFASDVKKLEAKWHRELAAPSKNMDMASANRSSLLKAQQAVQHSSRITFSDTGKGSEWFKLQPKLAQDYVEETIRNAIALRSIEYNLLNDIEAGYNDRADAKDLKIYCYSHDALRYLYKKPGANRSHAKAVIGEDPSTYVF